METRQDLFRMLCAQGRAYGRMPSGGVSLRVAKIAGSWAVAGGYFYRNGWKTRRALMLDLFLAGFRRQTDRAYRGLYRYVGNVPAECGDDPATLDERAAAALPAHRFPADS
ncbi:MAG: hypothetical protein FJX72_03025 [Armatimonadetes bacterium]|nr:hypothetical protein [Armatimonadota bacterium]